ncbi:MAG: DUF1778 domain-containing protein [Janthinobacterium lividum]
MAATTKLSKQARLNCRVSARIKKRAEDAASILGQSITDFTEAALEEKAQGVLERHERIVLSERDFAQFVAMIENPRPPTPELRDAMAEYQRLKAQFPESNL